MSLLRSTVASAAIAALVVGAAGSARAQIAETPRELMGVDVRERLNAQLPLDTRFVDHAGRARSLRELFDGNKPVVLNFAYHSCPVLCGMVLAATTRALKDAEWTVGDEFRVLTLSIDPRDTPAAAAQKRRETLASYGRAEAARGWEFWVGDEASVRRIADVTGFDYRYDPDTSQYAHPAAIVLLQPDGRVSRYLYGLEFDPQDVRLGLIEASQGRTSSTLERALLYCYRYDPASKSFVPVAERIMRIGASLTALVLLAFLAILWRREFVRRKSEPRTSDAPPPLRPQLDH